MPPLNPPHWCPYCKVWRSPPDDVVVVSGVAPHCPTCSSIMEPKNPSPLDPVTSFATVRLIAVLARFLVQCDVLQYLDERARETDTPVDNAAIALARAALEQLSKL